MPPNDEVQSSLPSDPKAVAGLHCPCPKLTVSFPSAHRAHLFHINLTPSGCQSCFQSNTPTPNLNILLFLSVHTFHLFPHTLGSSIALFQASYQHYTVSAVIFQDFLSATKYPVELSYEYPHLVPQAYPCSWGLTFHIYFGVVFLSVAG